MERIAYGIDRIDAHAMPTPTIVSSSTYWSWMKYTDSSADAAADERDRVRRLAARRGRELRQHERDEEAGDRVEREREAAPLHPARVQRATAGPRRRTRGAPSAGTKNSHMQNRPSQVNSCTTASCFIVDGISRMAVPISPNSGAEPAALASRALERLHVLRRATRRW